MAVRAPGRNAGDPPAQRRQHVAADHDVIGALAERDLDRDRTGMFQRRGHRRAVRWSGAACLGAVRRRTAGVQRGDAFIDDLFVRHVARPQVRSAS